MLYKEGENLKSTTITKDLMIIKNFTDENKTQTQILSIKPGFIFSSGNIELTLINKGTSQLNISYDNQEISIESGDIKKIPVSVNNSYSLFEIKTYEIFHVPIVYVLLNPNSSIEDQTSLLKINPEKVQIKVIKNQESNESLELINLADYNITDIELDTNISELDINFSKNQEVIEGKSREKIDFAVFSKKTGFIGGEIKIKYFDNEKKELIVPVEIYVFPENATIGEVISISSNNCEEINATRCKEGKEECVGGSLSYIGKEGNNAVFCCVGGRCVASEDDSDSFKWIILTGIIIVLAIGGYFVYAKWKKTKPIKPEEKLNQSNENYNKRIHGNLTRT